MADSSPWTADEWRKLKLTSVSSDVFIEALEDAERLCEAVQYALDAFTRAAEEHSCDYCRADAAVMERALAAMRGVSVALEQERS